ncbi:MAG: hypothetical protein FWC20_08750 [Oscillospiraceae bacterium]|nr:hypothetical protein [Oscillospiraceae bacterium]MCL2279477.1 hypothetical protein [Oscillospiraceae bacterium]
MGKYIKASVLLLLAAIPVIVVLMLIFGYEDTSEIDSNYYNEVDGGYIDDIGYGDFEAETEIANSSDLQVTTLTLGGLWFSSAIHNEVVRFNSENEYYQIRLSSFGAYIYYDPITGTSVIDYDAIARKNVDIFVDNMETQIALADLYSFIDADVQLSREDFFPNVLEALEAADGTLPIISHTFTIETMISSREIAEQVGTFNFSNVLNQLNQPTTSRFANFGLTWEFIIDRALHLCGNYFLDEENNRANFINNEFISALEIAAQPHGVDLDMIGVVSVLGTEWERFQQGDVLMNLLWVSSPEQILRYQAILGDIVFAGIPTVTGGAHIIRPQMGLGINAYSPHQEAAWSFVRRFLLQTYSDRYIHNALPIRIDLFEALIAELMTADILERVASSSLRWSSSSRRRDWSGAYTHIHTTFMYAITEDEAAQIREIVENAVQTASIDGCIHSIIHEETTIFIETNRSAEETARVIQERVQELLDRR